MISTLLYGLFRLLQITGILLILPTSTFLLYSAVFLRFYFPAFSNCQLLKLISHQVQPQNVCRRFQQISAFTPETQLLQLCLSSVPIFSNKNNNCRRSSCFLQSPGGDMGDDFCFAFPRKLFFCSIILTCRFLKRTTKICSDQFKT